MGKDLFDGCVLVDNKEFDENIMGIEEKLSHTLYYISILEEKCNELSNELSYEKDLERKVRIYEENFKSIQSILKIKSYELKELKKELKNYEKESEANKKKIDKLNITIKRMDDTNNYLRNQLKNKSGENFFRKVKKLF